MIKNLIVYLNQLIFPPNKFCYLEDAHKSFSTNAIVSLKSIVEEISKHSENSHLFLLHALEVWKM